MKEKGRKERTEKWLLKESVSTLFPLRPLIFSARGESWRVVGILGVIFGMTPVVRLTETLSGVVVVTVGTLIARLSKKRQAFCIKKASIMIEHG